MKTVEEIKEQINTISEVSEYYGWQRNYELEFKEIISHRMEHCSENLEKHLYEAKETASGLIVHWEGGHFSLPVYEALTEALNQKMENWNALIWEQILRQMFDENIRDKCLFYYATEMLLCKQ